MSATVWGQADAADTFIVKNGKPHAQIIIAQKPPRTTRLAAQELQAYIEKISGARLAIVTQPTGKMPIKLFVGQSAHTDRLKLTAKGLNYGAYRITSGKDWLAFIGDDTDFVPIEPWPRNNNDLATGKMQRAWNKITGKTWGYPLPQLRKHYTGATGLFGTPNEQHVDKAGNVNVWGFDERGSFNAVCAYLRSLGVRWYMPGELGQVIPTIKSIPLPKIDQMVRPAFAVRRFNFRFAHGRETAMWAMRLGVRDPYGLRVAHGMHSMTHNEAILKAHPDWFALYGGKRDNQPGKRLNHLCYSNPELFKETVAWARAQFDHFRFDTVSIMPPDAYISICQCKLCEGKESPELGSRGKLSNHVWDFVNRVAKEVAKTHPDKQIVCCAYGANTNPPSNIEKLEPNVQVIIVGGRRPTSSEREQIRKLREGWVAKTDNPIMVFENYPFTARGFYLPAFVWRNIGQSINATKGISKGEDIWLSVRQDFHEKDIGFNHFQVYFTARMYWGDKDQDVAAMLDEYCRLFYGPAGNTMKAFFTYCQDHWQAMEKDEAKADRALELFAAARGKVDDNSVYAKRLNLVGDFLKGLERKRQQLAQKRGPVPSVRLVGDPRGKIVIDGKLDDEAWRTCPTASTGRLRELQTGRQPIFGTSFKVAWRGDSLYFAIRCDELKGEKPNIATIKNQDQATWYGDLVEILLETETHSYYQIAVNPSGALIDLDRGVPRNRWFSWKSQAQVATQVADDHWTVEIRIPVVQDENDPLHQVIGRKPTQSLPWHINVCRQRIRKNGSEHSAFAPTGKMSFHVPMKFAHFYRGRSHRFEADASVTDYVIASGKAVNLMRSRKSAEALEAFVALADGEGVNDYQKSDALAQAALCARNLRDFDRDAKLAKKIPIEAVAKTVHMRNLLSQRKWMELIQRFGDEDFAKWPFWKAGEARYARALAYIAMGSGAKALIDLQAALPLTSDSHGQLGILVNLGRVHETLLKDDDAALRAYAQITTETKNTGSANYFYGVQGATRILTKRGKHDEALATLRLVEIDKLRGFWHASMSRSLGDTLLSAGRKKEALAAYRQVRAEAKASAADRKAAESAIKALTGE